MVRGRELTVIYGNSTPAVGPIETMVPGLPGQGVNGNSSPAVGPIETIIPGLPGQGIESNSTPPYRHHGSRASWAGS